MLDREDIFPWQLARKKMNSSLQSPTVFSNETIIEQPTDFTLLTEKYNKAAIKFIEDSVHEHKKPFFLYMGYHQTHHPQFARKPKFSTHIMRYRFVKQFQCAFFNECTCIS